jgi:hypothetical protein
MNLYLESSSINDYRKLIGFVVALFALTLQADSGFD